MDDTKTTTATTENRKLAGAALPPPEEMEGKLYELALRMEEASSTAQAKGTAIREGITETLRFYRLLPGQEARPDMSLFGSDAGMEKLLQQRLVHHQLREAVLPFLMQAAEGCLTPEPSERHTTTFLEDTSNDIYVNAIGATWIASSPQRAMVQGSLDLAHILNGGLVAERDEKDSDAWWNRKQRVRSVYRAAVEESTPQIAAFKGRMLALLEQHGPTPDPPFSLAGYTDESGMRRLLKDRLRVIAEHWCVTEAFLDILRGQVPLGIDREQRVGIRRRLPNASTDLRLQLALKHGLGLEIEDLSVHAVLTGQLFLTGGYDTIAWCRLAPAPRTHAGAAASATG